MLTTQIVDAAKSVQAADNHAAHIYSATQTAVRTVVAGVTMEALLTQRVAIGAQLRELTAPQAETVGVQIHAVEVRDVMVTNNTERRFPCTGTKSSSASATRSLRSKPSEYRDEKQEERFGDYVGLAGRLR